VLHKDLDNNVLYAGQGHDHPWLYSTELSADALTWITGAAPAPGERLHAKVRYRQSDQACELMSIGENGMRLRFDEPQRAVTPGQSVVLYSGDECLGGGIINSMNAIPFQEQAA
jgi:tRNA-specific 2-thiouridylase